jgi:hypothetical protein
VVAIRVEEGAVQCSVKVTSNRESEARETHVNTHDQLLALCLARGSPIEVSHLDQGFEDLGVGRVTEARGRESPAGQVLLAHQRRCLSAVQVPVAFFGITLTGEVDPADTDSQNLLVAYPLLTIVHGVEVQVDEDRLVISRFGVGDLYFIEEDNSVTAGEVLGFQLLHDVRVDCAIVVA